MCVYIYTHTHICLKEMCYKFTRGGAEFKMHCDFSDFSVLFEIIKSDSG